MRHSVLREAWLKRCRKSTLVTKCEIMFKLMPLNLFYYSNTFRILDFVSISIKNKQILSKPYIAHWVEFINSRSNWLRNPCKLISSSASIVATLINIDGSQINCWFYSSPCRSLSTTHIMVLQYIEYLLHCTDAIHWDTLQHAFGKVVVDSLAVNWWFLLWR